MSIITTDPHTITHIKNNARLELDKRNLHINESKTEKYVIKRMGNEEWRKCKILGSLLDNGNDISRYIVVMCNVLALSYKMYVRPHLDYGDVIYHKSRVDLMDLIERVQYKAALIVTGCWQGTSRVKLYDELGWELYLIEDGHEG